MQHNSSSSQSTDFNFDDNDSDGGDDNDGGDDGNCDDAAVADDDDDGIDDNNDDVNDKAATSQPLCGVSLLADVALAASKDSAYRQAHTSSHYHRGIDSAYQSSERLGPHTSGSCQSAAHPTLTSSSSQHNAGTANGVSQTKGSVTTTVAPYSAVTAIRPTAVATGATDNNNPATTTATATLASKPTACIITNPHADIASVPLNNSISNHDSHNESAVAPTTLLAPCDASAVANIDTNSFASLIPSNVENIDNDDLPLLASDYAPDIYLYLSQVEVWLMGEGGY